MTVRVVLCTEKAYRMMIQFIIYNTLIQCQGPVIPLFEYGVGSKSNTCMYILVLFMLCKFVLEENIKS
jgi:hypothetical protein